MPARALCLSLVLLALLLRTAAAGERPEDPASWLDGLYDRIAADLKSGRPLLFQVHVALCDNSIITCGGHGLGDGDDLDKNLYWASSGGFVGWFRRPGSAWTQIYREEREGDVREVRVMRGVFPAGPAWRRRGISGPIEAYVVAYAWRGKAIDAALDAFVADVYGAAPRTIRLEGGPVLQAGGAAQVVAYIGHNRLMDLPPYDFAAAERKGEKGQRPKGVVAVACASAPYLAPVFSAERVPLLLTADLLFAGSHSFEGAARSLIAGGTLAEMRAAASRSYAQGERKTVEHVRAAFTNPSDPRWPF